MESISGRTQWEAIRSTVYGRFGGRRKARCADWLTAGRRGPSRAVSSTPVTPRPDTLSPTARKHRCIVDPDAGVSAAAVAGDDRTGRGKRNQGSAGDASGFR